MNIDKYHAIARESEIRLFKQMAGWAVSLLLTSIALFGANMISMEAFRTLTIWASVLTSTSVAGHLLLAGQRDNKPLNFKRWLIVQATAFIIPLGGLFIYNYSTPQKQEVMKQSVAPEWPDDVNIEPDGMPSEEGVFH